jgi:hypothetical protein
VSFVGSVLGDIAGQKGPQDPGMLQVDPTTQNAQRSIVRSNNALDIQKNFLRDLQAQQGLGNQTSVFNQMQGVANGTGPNPAQAQLAQATGANVANQAALMAGQRGSAANAGMMARQAAQQGAGIQQNAAGQAATLQAQQSLGALNQMGGIANQQAQQQQQGTNAYTQAVQNQQNQLLQNAQQNNNARLQQASQANQVNQGNAAANNQLLGNLAGAAGSAMMLAGTGGAAAPAMMLAGGAGDSMGGSGAGLGTMLAAEGGQVPGPRSFVGMHFHGKAPMMAQGSQVPALVSPGERYLPPKEVQQVVEGKKAPMKAGEKIPGKAKVAGAKNDYANDTVPKTLETGGIVLPRSVTQSNDAEKKAIAFIQAVMAKHGNMPKGK